MNRKKTMHAKGLPDHCIISNHQEKKSYRIVPGVMRHIEVPYVENENKYNEEHGVTPAQFAAMRVGAVVGWNVAGANPAHYDEKGNLTIDYIVMKQNKRGV